MLDQKSCALLHYLINMEQSETVMTISKNLQQSRRKIYYHLDKINSSLPNHIKEIKSIPRIGILLEQEQKKACQNLLKEIDSFTYVLNMDERIQLMTIYIGIAAERVSLNQLIELMEVSRNTVLHDISELRKRLAQEPFEVSLVVSKSDGYYLECHPLVKIQYVYSLLHNMFFDATDDFLQILREKARHFVGCQLISNESLSTFLKAQVHNLEKDLGKKINRYEIEFMLRALPYLLLSYQNMYLTEQEKMTFYEEFNLIRRRKEYQVAINLSTRLQEATDIVLDNLEVALIAMLLLSFRKDKDMHVTSDDFKDLKQVIEQFVYYFEVCSNFELDNRELLIRNLLMHAKALLFRKTYGVFSKNPLTEQIKAKYVNLFTLTKECASILEEEWIITLNDDDIAYLTVHFGGALRNTESTFQSVQQVYLICDEGRAIQRLFLKQCQMYLPKDSIKAVFTTEQFKSVEDIIETDMLISTNETLTTTYPLIKVHPILTHDDIIRMMNFVKFRSISEAGTEFYFKLNKLLKKFIPDLELAKEAEDRIRLLINNELLTIDSEFEHES